MCLLLDAAPALKILVDILGVAGILIFGTFVLVFIVDLLLSFSHEDRKGIFFNKGKQEEVAYSPTPAVPTEQDGVVYYNSAPDKEEVVNTDPIAAVSSVDFNKAIEEQKELQKRNNQNPVRQPEKDRFSDDFFEDEEDDEDDISPIIEEVAKKALKALKDEEEPKEKRVFKIKNEVSEEVKEEPKESEELKKLNSEREELEKKIKELEELRKQDRDELLKAMQEIRDKEPVIVEVDKKKEEEDKRRYAQIARMNARLNSINRTTSKLEKKQAAPKKPLKTTVVEVEEIPAPKPQVVEAPVIEKKIITETTKTQEKRKLEMDLQAKQIRKIERLAAATTKIAATEKPRFKKEYYENRLLVLEQELKDAEKELKDNNKDYLPLVRVQKAYERDNAKLHKKEVIVAKQKLALYGAGNSSKKVNPEKKEKLDENVKALKELKESVYNCEQVINKNKDRLPILEKNNKLVTKQIKRLQDDIQSVKEAIVWYRKNPKA